MKDDLDKPYVPNVFVVTGASSGLGKAIADQLATRPDSFVLRIHGPNEEGARYWPGDMDECWTDLASETESALTADWIKDRTRRYIEQVSKTAWNESECYPVLINCAGINYIEWFDQADFSEFDKLMNLNVKAGLMLTHYLIGKKPPAVQSDHENWFRGTGAILNIVSNASHVAMTNSAFYNASKGAFHIATLALARELRKTHGICVFGISPNKLSGTSMSEYIENRVPSLRGWTPEQAASYQLAALPSGEETDPIILAEFIGFLLSKPERHKYLTNTVIPYGA
jgi:NAD(P)-dependent dehydrogenase (short-subunit alcohol dehydrogenase family)